MLPRQHRRGAPLAGAAGDARRGGSGARQPHRRHPVARRATASSRTSARSSPPRRRASTAFRCCPTRRERCGVGEGDTVRAVPLSPAIVTAARSLMPRATRTMRRVQLRRHPRADAQLRRARARQPRRRAQRAAASPIRARRRCRASPRCARSPRAASRRPCCRRTSARACAALRALGLRRQRRGRRSRAPRATRRALLAACSSAAAMWVANAATVSPSADTRRRPRALHAGQPRRALPSLARGADHDARAARDLRRRSALRRARSAARRAAARRRRRRQPHALRRRRRQASSSSSTAGARYRRRRRAGDASRRGRRARRREAIARRHGLDPARTRVRAAEPGARSTPASSTTTSSRSGNGNVLFCHERAFVDQPAVLADARRARRTGASRRSSCATTRCRSPMRSRPICSTASCSRAPDGRLLLVAPAEVPRATARVARCLDRLLVTAADPIAEVLDVRPAAEHAQRRRPGVPAPARAR